MMERSVRRSDRFEEGRQVMLVETEPNTQHLMAFCLMIINGIYMYMRGEGHDNLDLDRVG